MQTIKNNYQSQKVQMVQKGGRKLGYGGFGCVVTPPIPCKRTSKKVSARSSKVNAVRICRLGLQQTARF